MKSLENCEILHNEYDKMIYNEFDKNWSKNWEFYNFYFECKKLSHTFEVAFSLFLILSFFREYESSKVTNLWSSFINA